MGHEMLTSHGLLFEVVGSYLRLAGVVAAIIAGGYAAAAATRAGEGREASDPAFRVRGGFTCIAVGAAISLIQSVMVRLVMALASESRVGGLAMTLTGLGTGLAAGVLGIVGVFLLVPAARDLLREQAAEAGEAVDVKNPAPVR